ncbi:hypothetical protein GCM10011581_06930 [Saccharopolyspora subtropica]|uniref:Lsr2 dimerization domain-containing protein n=1 Tax=Saccharopolyspora thermophila TaxID=89367 RepID=A0A917JM45_9PSEU|nr:Lsr2 family protein [Saccharopolyspora subtropica]GGI72547.1 hypothetical protein GCM10011581_06930 [Saccharopolyspora subtropica]
MAERIQVELVDDIDGSPAKHTVTFALDGVTYEIDLNDRHAQHLRSVLERYIKVARVPKPVVRTTRQQEREEKQAREVNKQLTEQIRGAAQRTREHLSKKAAEQAEQVAEEPTDTEQALFVAPELKPKPKPKPDGPRVPAVSMPQFSSAVD